MRKVTLPANFNNHNFVELTKSEKNPALKLRYLAMSYLQSGKTVLETAKLVYKSSRMVHRWINNFADEGLEGLKDKPGRGRHAVFDEGKLDELRLHIINYREVTGKTRIIGKDLQKTLEDKYDIYCTLPTVYNILTKLGEI